MYKPSSNCYRVNEQAMGAHVKPPQYSYNVIEKYYTIHSIYWTAGIRPNIAQHSRRVGSIRWGIWRRETKDTGEGLKGERWNITWWWKDFEVPEDRRRSLKLEYLHHSRHSTHRYVNHDGNYKDNCFKKWKISVPAFRNVI